MLENIFPKTPTKLISAEVERCHGYVTLIVIIIESFKNLWPTFRLFSISNRKMENSPGTQIIISRLLQKKKQQFQLAFTIRISVKYALGKSRNTKFETINRVPNFVFMRLGYIC